MRPEHLGQGSVSFASEHPAVSSAAACYETESGWSGPRVAAAADTSGDDHANVRLAAAAALGKDCYYEAVLAVGLMAKAEGVGSLGDPVRT